MLRKGFPFIKVHEHGQGAVVVWVIDHVFCHFIGAHRNKDTKGAYVGRNYTAYHVRKIIFESANGLRDHAQTFEKGETRRGPSDSAPFEFIRILEFLLAQDPKVLVRGGNVVPQKIKAGFGASFPKKSWAPRSCPFRATGFTRNCYAESFDKNSLFQ